MAVIVGVPFDDGISEHNKCAITQNIGGVDVTVIAYVTEEAQVAFNSVWESPFEGDTLGNVASKTGGLIQSETGATSKSQLHTRKVWEGAEPPEVTLTLKLVAYTDAKREVNDPIRYLAQMNAAEINEIMPNGRIPQEAAFKFGKSLPKLMVISNVSFNANAPKTKEGYFAYNTLSITATPKQMINKSEIPNHFQ